MKKKERDWIDEEWENVIWFWEHCIRQLKFPYTHEQIDDYNRKLFDCLHVDIRAWFSNSHFKAMQMGRRTPTGKKRAKTAFRAWITATKQGKTIYSSFRNGVRTSHAERKWFGYDD